MPRKNKNIEIGKKGEDMAADYLKRKNYRILARNYRSGRIEIDIIAIHGDQLVFIEVKTRTGSEFGYPEESVDDAKQDAIQTCAEDYILDTGWEGDIRFDIIGVSLHDPSPIYHIVDAF
jgi:putative endonuclease